MKTDQKEQPPPAPVVSLMELQKELQSLRLRVEVLESAVRQMSGGHVTDLVSRSRV